MGTVKLQRVAAGRTAHLTVVALMGERNASGQEWWRTLELVSFSVALGDDPGDPFADAAAGRGRAERIKVFGDRRPSLVDSGELRRAAVERGGEVIKSIVATHVGEVGALFIGRLGVGEVEGVGLSASAHRHIGPVAVGDGLAVVEPEFEPEMAWFAFMQVGRSHRRHGAATALWAETERVATASGSTSIYVSAMPSESAVGFYLSRGCVLAPIR